MDNSKDIFLKTINLQKSGRCPAGVHWWGIYKYEALGLDYKKDAWRAGEKISKIYADFYEKFKNDPEGFLNEVKKSWAENIEFNKEAKSIRIIGRKVESCFCPLADKSLTPKEFCNCSVGWAKQTYGTVLGKQVNVTIEESILYGGERCSFLIKF